VSIKNAAVSISFDKFNLVDSLSLRRELHSENEDLGFLD